MLDVKDRIEAIRQSVSGDVANSIDRLISQAPDARLNRVNPIAFAREHALSEHETVSAFLHATRLGLFELSWNVVCASCGGVLHLAASLQAIDQDRYRCALCAVDCEPNLDEIVEITFTVDPRVRRIPAHHPETLSLWAYTRQIFWSSGSDLPDDPAKTVSKAIYKAVELQPGARVICPIKMRNGLAVLFEPVTHRSLFLEVDGATAASPQELTVSLENLGSILRPLRVAPGPLILTLENGTTQRLMPILWIVGDALKRIVARRIPVLSAKRLLTHQTFRDLYRTTVLDTHQRFKITSMSFMFTDLKGSTELYERIGDLEAFDLVRAHFQLIEAIVSGEGGAVVKTIGDAIMATFPEPGQSVAAAFEIRAAISEFNGRDGRHDLLLKIGLHTGPCLAVVMNDHQDYFGQTVNIASRVQGMASTDRVLATSAIMDDPEVQEFLKQRRSVVNGSKLCLRGISRGMLVYEIADRNDGHDTIAIGPEQSSGHRNKVG